MQISRTTSDLKTKEGFPPQMPIRELHIAMHVAMHGEAKQRPNGLQQLHTSSLLLRPRGRHGQLTFQITLFL